MAGPKLEQPDTRPKEGAQGSALGDAPHFLGSDFGRETDVGVSRPDPQRIWPGTLKPASRPQSRSGKHMGHKLESLERPCSAACPLYIPFCCSHPDPPSVRAWCWTSLGPVGAVGRAWNLPGPPRHRGCIALTTLVCCGASSFGCRAVARYSGRIHEGRVWAEFGTICAAWFDGARSRGLERKQLRPPRSVASESAGGTGFRPDPSRVRRHQASG